ncbi:hypothetical protein ANN_20882 [Periplaneta americana]|uniref:Uncharacterized protein n=1 Tax=Periplaneta americana TaxID=6978 RepID=A0ABQ8SDZ8_PERAM|nr:hypothetical protein ANN_20882 [Periplaneta americana]
MRVARCDARIAQIRTTQEIVSGFSNCESRLGTLRLPSFGSVKKQLRGQRYETLENIRKAVRQCLREDERISTARKF